MWGMLNSRKFAVTVLAIMTGLLVVSTFFPSYFTLGETGWAELSERKPFLYWLSSHLATPFLVTSPLFILVSLFLFLSTLVCTVSRVNKWLKLKASEFSKDKAFSFSHEGHFDSEMETLVHRIALILKRGRWDQGTESNGSTLTVTGHKGMSGFWGSVIFHAGLLICFLAPPVSLLTTFRGELVIPVGVQVRLRDGFASHAGKDPKALPDASVRVEDFRARYYEGRFKYDFGGNIIFRDGTREKTMAFAVNAPAFYEGYQFTLHEYGYSPHVVIRKAGKDFFDYYVNLRHPQEGDYFGLQEEGLRMLVMFFPDFVREGDTIGTKSQLPDNPMVMIKLVKGEGEVFRGLFKPGEKQVVGEYEVSVPDFRHWVNLVVVQEAGIMVVIAGFALGLAGLLLRVLSNERSIEFVLMQRPEGVLITVRGYSRYYPAFLEKEVRGMAETLKEEQDVQG